MKKYICFLFFVFLISLASAATLSMSPTQINFNKNSLCQKVTIKTDGEYNLTGKILFAEEGYSQRKLSVHKLLPEKLGINISYPQELSIDENKTFQVCMQPKKGNYHGVLLYRIEGKPVEVGIWINSSFEKKNFLSLTGNSIEGKSSENSFYFVTIFLTLILGLLIIYLRNKNRKIHK